MILEGKTEKIVNEIQNEIQPKTFWEPKMGKNINLYFIDLMTFQKYKKYQIQFLEMHHLLNEDSALVLENIVTKEIIVIAFPINAKKLLIPSLFKNEEYEILENIKNDFQTEITEYLQNL